MDVILPSEAPQGYVQITKFTKCGYLKHAYLANTHTLRSTVFVCVGLGEPLQLCSPSQRMLCAFCILIIHSALDFCTGTGKMPPRPFHHKSLQPPRSIREMRCPKPEQGQHRLPGRGREEGEQRWVDGRKGQSRPACQITAETQTRRSNCNRKVG